MTLYTRREVADHLQVSVGQVGVWIRRGELQETRLGTRTSRIHNDDLEAFINSRSAA